MNIIKNIKKKIVPVKFDMSKWSNATFLNQKTLVKIIDSLEHSPKSEALDYEHSYNEFVDQTLTLLKKSNKEFVTGSLTLDVYSAARYISMINQLSKCCDEYLSGSHNSLHSANRIKGIKKIKSLCTKSLKDIKSGPSSSVWSVTTDIKELLENKWYN